jgi:hypothetical protein
MEKTRLRFLGHELSQRELKLVREVVASCDGLSRAELANTVCELLGWRRRSGSLKGRECRDFLEKLEVAALLRLPEKRAGRPLGIRTEVPLTPQGEPGVEVEGTAGELGAIELERVQTEDQRRLFRELVERYHYLGHAVPFGAHLRYLVYASVPERRLVACLQFSSAAWKIGVRDRWIGWDGATRARHLVHVVNNSRFLVLPWVHVRNLASRVLSGAVRRMAADWEQHYRVEPFLVETLVDPTRYRGSCYRAANWIELGRTSGHGRVYRQRQRVAVTPKTVLVYPLVGNAVSRLREGEDAGLGRASG